ncbi:hypothetical protein C3K47_09565 [Solitalea longa]|uniref:Uncharacterized protein n=1 Tax=Solitalea longa TaxID=2079460 RepID=A0A2S5A3B1_9SPHI|nr:hypothetical protein C3K47_09565 [Solitalea longa]
MTKAALLILMLTTSIFANAQDSLKNKPFTDHLHSSLQFRNNHLWRGSEVATGLVYTGNLYVQYGNVYGGFWAGGNTTGSYKEFNTYVGFKVKNFSAELWDIYNYSPGAGYNNREFFNYNSYETGRFWDLRTNYTISNKIPLTLSWNTVIFGRDRNLSNTENRYSTFVSAEYPFVKNDKWEISGRVGYSFALNNTKGETGNFFAPKAGVNEVSLMFTRNLKIANYTLPVGFWPMWNPVTNKAYFQFSIQPFSF